MKYEAIDRQARQYRVAWMCKLLEASRSSFYEWRIQREGYAEKLRVEALLFTQVKAAHEASRGTYGSPRLHKSLVAQGITVGRRRVERLMREACLVGRSRRKFMTTTRRDETETPAENVLARQFEASSPNQKWVTDIPYLATKQGFMYLAAMLDLFSNHVVGFAIADHMRTDLALQALNMAVQQRRPPPGLLHHSDRGSQYTSKSYQNALAAADITCSMSRKGECWDNACAESFFGRLKEELGHKLWETKGDAAAAVSDYITRFYNTKRTQKRLGYLSPAMYELRRSAIQRVA